MHGGFRHLHPLPARPQDHSWGWDEMLWSKEGENLGSSQARRHLEAALPDVLSVLFSGREVSVSALRSPSQDLPRIGLP